MEIPFSPDEVLQMAEQIERNGAKFYRRAADQAADAALAELLGRLAGWEDEHERTFTDLRRQVVASGASATDPQEGAGLAGRYLQALAEGEVFDTRSDPSEWLGEGRSREDILRYAVGLEKDSVVFYTGMKEVVPGTDNKQHIDRIIAEEMHHISELAKMLSR